MVLRMKWAKYVKEFVALFWCYWVTAKWRSFGNTCALLCALWLALLGSIGPAIAQQSGYAQDLQRLRQDLQDIQKYVYSESFSGGGKKAVVSGPPLSADAATRLHFKIQSMQSELMALTGRLEQIENSLRRNESRLNRLVSDVDLRLRTLETASGIGPAFGSNVEVVGSAGSGAGVQKPTLTVGADAAPSVDPRIDQLAPGITQLKRGSSQLARGTGELAPKGGQVVRGNDQLASGITQLRPGSGQVARGIGQLAPRGAQVVRGNDQSSSGISQLKPSSGQLTRGTDQLAPGQKLLGTVLRSELNNVKPVQTAPNSSQLSGEFSVKQPPIPKTVRLPGVVEPAAPSGKVMLLPDGTAKQQYKYAFGLLKKRDFLNAARSLKAFVDKNPTHSLAGNAMYWLAETHYEQRQYAEAARLFLDGYRRYPKSNKAPDNLLKLGKSLNSVGEKKSACAAWNKLLKSYPKANSRLVRSAKRSIRQNKCA
ncbi:MAG: tol-pal system protein YbgF [Rhodospirillaceae bacterium]|nr:tol-pal system protein YbgF [Rhodospirillaceae bacterium]